MENKKKHWACISLILALLFLAPTLQAEQSADDLAKKSQNPVADMISLPLQYNTYLNTGPEGSRTQDVLLVQPFVNYNMKDGWYLTTGPSISVNWSTTDSDDQWIVPIGGGIGKIHKIGKQPVNLSAKAYYNVEAPRSGAEWQLQFQMQFLFPK